MKQEWPDEARAQSTPRSICMSLYEGSSWRFVLVEEQCQYFRYARHRMAKRLRISDTTYEVLRNVLGPFNALILQLAEGRNPHVGALDMSSLTEDSRVH